MAFRPDGQPSRFQADPTGGGGPTSRGQVARTPGKDMRRAELEALLAEQIAAADAAGEDLPGPVAQGALELMRVGGQGSTALARGVLGLPTLAEQAVTGPINAVSGAKFRGPFERAQGFLSPAALAPRNSAEKFASRVNEGLGGAASGVIGGAQVTRQAASPVTQAVGRSLEELPGRQALAAVTGGTAGQVLEEAGANETTQGIGSLLGGAAAFKGAVPKNLEPTPGPRPAIDPVARARAAGYKVLPSAADRAGGMMAEAAGGPAYLRTQFSKANEDVTRRLVAEDIGLRANSPITDATLANARERPLEIYASVRQSLPEMSVDDELRQFFSSLGNDVRTNPLLANNPRVEALRMRADAAETLSSNQVMDAISNWRRNGYQRMKRQSPEQRNLGRAELQAANALESALERGLAASGQDPALVGAFRDARQILAKISDVENAMVGGRIDPDILRRMGDRGHPLSGRLKIIADTARDLGPELLSSTRTPVPEAITQFGAMKRAAQGLYRKPLAGRLLSDNYQQKIGPVDPQPGPGSALGAYFDAPSERTPPQLGSGSVDPQPGPGSALGAYFDDGSPSFAPSERTPPQLGSGSVDFEPTAGLSPVAALRNPERPGGMDIASEWQPGMIELPPATARMGDLELVDPPPVFEGMAFEATPGLGMDDLIGDLRLGDSPGAGLPYQGAPLAEGMAQNVPGTELYPELRAIRQGRDEVVLADELTLEPDWVPPPPSMPVVDFASTAGLPPVAALRNPARPGEMSLASESQPGMIELPPATARMGDLTLADTPPVSQGMAFEATPGLNMDDLIAGLGLTDSPGAGLPSQGAPRAPGMSQNVPGTELSPERRAIRQGSDEVVLADELALEPDWVPPPSSMPVVDFAPTAGLPPVSALRNPARPGEMGLAPESQPGMVELPPATAQMGDLTLVDTPPVSQGMAFEATPGLGVDDSIAGLGLADSPGAGLPSQGAPRAPGMAQNVPGTAQAPERRAIRQGRDEVSLGDELTLEPDFQRLVSDGDTSLSQLSEALGLGPDPDLGDIIQRARELGLDELP